MNKKFSTLVLGALLAGAFTTANAETVSTQEEFEALIKNGVLTLEEGDDELVFAEGKYTIPYFSDGTNYPYNGVRGEYMVVNTPDLTIKGDGEVEITGRMVLAAENVTVSGLTIVNNGLKSDVQGDATYFFNKSAISVLANKVTITGNTFVGGENE